MRCNARLFAIAFSCALLGGVYPASAALTNLNSLRAAQPSRATDINVVPGLALDLAQNSARPAILSGVLVAADDETGADQPSERSVSAPTVKTPDISGTGILDYSYALELPKFHGIEPKISLNYSSVRKTKTGGLYQGWLGYGWSLSGFDVIERTRKNGSVPSYSDNWDVFQLNGEELVDCRNNDDEGVSLTQEDMALPDDSGNQVSPSCLTTT